MNTERIWKKTAALTMAGMVAFGLVGCGSASTKETVTEETAAASSSDSEKLENALVSTSFGKSDGDPGKEETIYILTDPSGSISDVTVSDWLKNTKGEDTIEDVSTLTDIKNVKGEETYTTGSDNALTWTANGNDIYYQGKTTKDLPVSVKVSYKLDGNDISAEELSGKSGKVTIRFDYENNTKETIDVDGTKVTVPVPFAMVSGVLLPTDNFAHVEVTNGKVVSDSDSNIVMGVALPGLSDALALTKDQKDLLGAQDMDIPDYVEITADTVDCEVGPTMTLATPGALSNLGFDFGGSSDLSDLDSDMDKLTDGMKELRDGGSQLADGSAKLSDGAAKLNSKMSDLTAGTQSIADGTKKLAEAVASGQTSMKDLNDLIAGYSAIHNALNSGTFKTDMDTAKALAAKSAELTSFQQNFVKMTDEEKFQYVYSQMTDEQKAAFDAQVTAAVEQALPAAVQQATGGQYTADLLKAGAPEKYQEIYTAVYSQVMAAAGKTAVETAVKQMQEQVEQARTQSTAAAEQAAPSRGYEALAAGGSLSENDTTWIGITGMTQTEWNYIATWATVSDATKSTAAEYIAKYTAFETKYGKLSAMADGLKTQMAALGDGTKQLSDGAAKLNSSVKNQLAPGVSQLADGASDLAAGAQDLSDGLVRFDEEGISKIAELTGKDVTGLTNRLKALQRAGDNYNNFSGVADGVQSSVKFLFETEAVDKDGAEN